jgi:hypothetical protein
MPDLDPTQIPEQTTPAESQPETPIDPQPADQAQPDPAPEEATPPTEPTPPQIVPGEEPFVLPSGVTCVMRRGKGRDLLAAQRMAGQDPHQVMYALLASLCTFDGGKRVMEDVLDMGLADVMRLTSKFSERFGGDFLPSTSGPSSTSPQ